MKNIINKNKTVCFTGHRQVNKENLTSLYEEIEKAIHNGYDTFLSGGAVGFDQYSAMAVIELKKKYPSIKLVLILPCNKEDMSRKWSDIQKEYFYNICNSADEIIFVSEKYYDGCMKERNKRLAEMSSYCIAYYKKYRSGTGQTVRMVEKNGGTIVNLYQ